MKLADYLLAGAALLLAAALAVLSAREQPPAPKLEPAYAAVTVPVGDVEETFFVRPSSGACLVREPQGALRALPAEACPALPR